DTLWRYLKRIDHILFGMLRDSNNHCRPMCGMGHKSHIRLDFASQLICRQTQRNNVMDGHNGWCTWKEWWCKIGHMKKIHSGITGCIRCCELFPYDLLNVLITGSKT